MRPALFLAGAFLACGGAEQRPEAPDSPAETPALATSPALPSDEPLLGEAAARQILGDAFRGAGLRILSDQRLEEDRIDVTLDGFDPERRIGFEYVAAEERGLDLSSAEREALARHSELRVLVVDATSAERVRQAAARFLEALAAEGRLPE